MAPLGAVFSSRRSAYKRALPAPARDGRTTGCGTPRGAPHSIPVLSRVRPRKTVAMARRSGGDGNRTVPVAPRVLDARACRLRRKLPSSPRQFVITVRGVGYRLTEEL